MTNTNPDTDGTEDWEAEEAAEDMEQLRRQAVAVWNRLSAGTWARYAVNTRHAVDLMETVVVHVEASAPDVDTSAVTHSIEHLRDNRSMELSEENGHCDVAHWIMTPEEYRACVDTIMSALGCMMSA